MQIEGNAEEIGLLLGAVAGGDKPTSTEQSGWTKTSDGKLSGEGFYITLNENPADTDFPSIWKDPVDVYCGYHLKIPTHPR